MLSKTKRNKETQKTQKTYKIYSVFYFTVSKNITVLIEQNNKMLTFNEFVSKFFWVQIQIL